MVHVSIGTKQHKSRAWKMAHRERHMENVRYRADLHRQKQGISDPNRREPIQAQIDEISKRGVGSQAARPKK